MNQNQFHASLRLNGGTFMDRRQGGLLQASKQEGVANKYVILGGGLCQHL